MDAQKVEFVAQQIRSLAPQMTPPELGEALYEGTVARMPAPEMARRLNAKGYRWGKNRLYEGVRGTYGVISAAGDQLIAQRRYREGHMVYLGVSRPDGSYAYTPGGGCGCLKCRELDDDPVYPD